MSASLFSREPVSSCSGAARLRAAPEVVACLELDVVGDVQRLNLAEELFAFGVMGVELVATFAEGVQLEADTLAANTVGVELFCIGMSPVEGVHTKGE